MRFEKFGEADLPLLTLFQPPTWGDLYPRFVYFIHSNFCDPIKLMVGDKAVGIGTVIYHKDSAWLACIVVLPDERNQGYGKIITRELIDRAHARKIETIYLDATELGYPVYANLGFETVGEYFHLKTEIPVAATGLPDSVIPFREEFGQALLDLDQQVSGEDREMTLRERIMESMIFVRNQELLGFYFPTLSDGLIIAREPEAGLALMQWRIQSRPFAGLPSKNKPALEYLHQHHFKQFRSSRRMCLGDPRPWQPARLFNRISGQLG